MKIAITGANGLFGHALVQVIGGDGVPRPHGFRGLGWSHHALPLTRADADLTRLPDVHRVLLAARPDAIVHAAAAPDPDACERNPEYAFQTNVVATENVVQVAKELAIPVAQISTDAVFDGMTDSPRTESDPTHPLSVYGKTKLLAERAVMQLEHYWIFRVSVLFGPGKANFISKGLQALRSGNSYAVAADQIGTATYTLDAAGKILEVMESPQYGLFHLSNPGACSRLDLMQQAAILAGLPTDKVVGKPLSEMGRLAPRPKYAVMEMKALKMAGISPPRAWQSALAEYIENVAVPVRPLP
jgi:dTDP-4-dehydrorhamnose reductase